MTPQERELINKTIHEKVMGGCWHEKGVLIGRPDEEGIYSHYYCRKCGVVFFCFDNPDYDLNRIREVEEKLILRGWLWGLYVKRLESIVGRGISELIHASAEQKARAIVKVIGE